MNTKPARYFVVHNRAGRIFAIAPISAGQNREGMEIGWRPMARRNQIVTEVELSDEQTKLALHELLDFQLKAEGGVPRLQPIKLARTKTKGSRGLR